MLRGDLSPVAITEDIAITEVQAPETVAEMLRGENSPVDAAPEIAVTDVQRTETVAEMLGGDQSPIAHGLELGEVVLASGLSIDDLCLMLAA